jgi:ABC-2 type transport system ATP-binding protein
VAFIKHGEVIRTSALKALVDGETRLTIRARNVLPETLAGLDRWGRGLRADGDTLTLTVSDEGALPDITRYLVAQGAEVYALTPERISLEDLFIQVVGTDGGL